MTLYITPGETLRYLSYIESRLPYREYAVYKPSLAPKGVITNNDLNREARKMFDFVGLNNYEPDIKYANLDENMGGNIDFINSTGRKVRINLSNRYCEDWRSSIAVLAHEICHKLLQEYNIIFTTTIMNEVHTDLATIYVGFGEIIINGYNIHIEHSRQCLGYLNPQIYKTAYLFVSLVCGKKRRDEINITGYDNFVDEAVALWEMTSDKKKLLKEYFIKNEEGMAELQRNITLLEQILNQCRKRMGDYYRKFYDDYFGRMKISNDEYQNPIAAFENIYYYSLGREEHKFIKLRKTVNEALHNIYVTYQEEGVIDLKYEVICPFCGMRTSASENIQDKKSILLCPSCKRHFLYDGEFWNPTIYQREIQIAKNKKLEEENKYLEECQKKLDYDADKKIRAIKDAANKEIADIKKNEQDICKEAIRKNIPLIIRWLFNIYVK